MSLDYEVLISDGDVRNVAQKLRQSEIADGTPEEELAPIETYNLAAHNWLSGILEDMVSDCVEIAFGPYPITRGDFTLALQEATHQISNPRVQPIGAGLRAEVIDALVNQVGSDYKAGRRRELEAGWDGMIYAINIHHAHDYGMLGIDLYDELRRRGLATL